MENKEKELREEFQNFADRIIWSNDDGSEKYIGVGNMADWWIKKIESLLKSKQEEIEEAMDRMKKVHKFKVTEVEDIAKENYNQALDDLKPIITNLLK